MSSGTRYVLKTVYNDTVNKDNRLKVEKKRIDYAVNQAEEKAKATEKTLEKEKNRVSSSINSRFEEAEAQLHKDLEDLSDKIRVEIGKSNVKFREEIEGIGLELGKINLRTDALKNQVSELSESFNKKIRIIADRIKDKEQRARAYFQEFNTLMVKISALNPDKLAPKEFKTLEDRLDFAKRNVDAGDYEACIGTSQIAIPTATNLLAELTLQNEEFKRTEHELLDHIKDVREIIKFRSTPEKNMERLQAEGTEIEFDGDISFWSDGLLVETATIFETLVADTEINRKKMDIEALKANLEKIKLIPTAIDECTSFAHKECLVSFSVELMVKRIDEAIVLNDGWERMSSGFEEKDRRRSYSMCYSCGDDLVATFVVMPSRSVKRIRRDGSEELEPIRYKADVYCEKDKHLAEIAKSGILACLREAGIDAEKNKNSTVTNFKPIDFVNTAFTEADKLKNSRVEETRNLFLRL